MYSGAINKKMVRCKRCGKYKHPLLFDMKRGSNSISNVICEKCLSKGFVNAYNSLLQKNTQETLLNNIPLIEAKMYCQLINKN